jgi:hypothetical protein
MMAAISSASMAAALEHMHLKTLRRRIDFDRVGPKRRRLNSRYYPHCGTRHQARLRRQIAAGQLTFGGVVLQLS